MNVIDFTGMTQDQKFEAAGKFAGVPANIFTGMWQVESGKGTNMTSRAGARGHFQTMPATQSTWEERTGRKFDPDNFEDSLNMAALTMRENMGRFKTIPESLRAYNAGWNRDRWNNEENQAYVGKIADAGGFVSLGTLTHIENDMRNTSDEGTFDRAYRGKVFDSALFERAWQGEPAGDLGSLRARMQKQYLSDFEKGVINKVGVDTVAAAVGDTNAVALATAASASAKENAQAATASYVANHGDQTTNTSTNLAVAKETAAKAQAALEREQYAQSLTVGDKWGAHFTYSLSAGMMRKYANDVGDAYAPGFSYAARAAEVEKGMSQKERDYLRESVSDADIDQRAQHISQMRQDAAIMGHMSTSSNLLWGVAAGFSDPAGWVAGLGVGKAAQIAKVGAATYMAAGRPVAAFFAAGAEGAAGNVLVRGTLDAMGNHTTFGDYVTDAAFGFGMGAVMAAPGLAMDARVQAVQQGIAAEGRIANAELAARAQELAGPDATPAQLHKAIEAVQDADAQSWAMATLGNVDNADRLFARTDVGYEPTMVEVQTADGPRMVAQDQPHTSVFANETDRRAFVEARGLHNSIADGDMQNMVAEVIARSEAINGRIDLSPERLKTFLQKFDLEATSTTMLNSESSVARAVAAMLMENPEGAAGRRSTASISRAAHFDMYLGNIGRNADQMYLMWAGEQGIGKTRATFNGERTKFDRLVQLEMDRRWNGRPEGSVHPLVKRAADMYDEGYRVMGRDQRLVGTLGAEAIDPKATGYFQRSWNLRAIRDLSNNLPKRNAFLNAIEDQFRTVAGFTDSADFNVRALSVQYLARLEHRATGMLDTPSNVFAQDAGDIVQDALRSLGMTGDQVEAQMRRFTRGASGHTKTRIDMDYSKSYSDGAGNDFVLVDFLDNDMNSLYRKYAARTSGDVALAKYGIMGQNGLSVLREAMEKTGATQKELRAFEQWSAEMTGKRFGAGDPLLVQNARLLTNLTRMGGAIFPQMGAFVDATAGLGVARALRLTGSMNQMRKEVQQLAKGMKTENQILGGFEGIGPEFGAAEYRMSGLFDTGEIEVDIAGAESVGRITRGIRAGAHVQRIMSGHRWVTAAQTRGVADQVVRKALRFVREGGESKALADMGIDDAMVANLRKNLGTIAEFDKHGELSKFDPMKLSADDVDGKRAVIAFRDAVMRGTQQIMNKEFAGESGKWAHNGWLKLLFQFRTFSMVAQQKQFNRILAVHGAAKLTGLMLGGMAVAAPIHMARVAMKASLMKDGDREEYINKNLHPLALGRATMNYLASVGLWADVVEAASGLGTGWADAFNIDLPNGLQPTGGRMMRDTDMLGGQFAPSLGVINDLSQGAMGKTDKLWKTAPWASLPYIQPILMGIDSHVSED